MSDEDPDDLTLAYRRVFDPADPNAKMILADLAEQCFAAKSTQGPDASATSFFNGKRAVFLYIAGKAALPLISR